MFRTRFCKSTAARNLLNTRHFRCCCNRLRPTKCRQFLVWLSRRLRWRVWPRFHFELASCKQNLHLIQTVHCTMLDSVTTHVATTTTSQPPSTTRTTTKTTARAPTTTRTTTTTTTRTPTTTTSTTTTPASEWPMHFKVEKCGNAKLETWL